MALCLAIVMIARNMAMCEWAICDEWGEAAATGEATAFLCRGAWRTDITAHHRHHLAAGSGRGPRAPGPGGSLCSPPPWRATLPRGPARLCGPTSGDPRACFVTVDETEVRWRRVEYDVEATAHKIEASGALDHRFAHRLRTAT